ncbi:uncharacterized mitochondrial protein AtMg00810-like [Amaranthus tricolor]|uniref:uncharacterized mitochondrial protein AtMg00810-like n=1 Tax=Amaranthus tricolor TaxID=29722 RepID=UPI00258550B9|nr:uncharacterized mitochondrial protein AtMg00810-like [Amaranthus tricolor]
MSKLSSKFAMKDLGPLSYFLGIVGSRTPAGLFLSQNKYAAEILDKADMSQCKPAPTPVTTSNKLCADVGYPYDNSTLYRSLARALQYLTFTRLDISYAVQQVCLFMHDPRVEHMAALHRILRCPDTRRITSGYFVFLGDNLISWFAKRQPTLSKSSAEAEYRGVANIVSETCWIRNLLLELHCPNPMATLVYCDNVSTVYMSGNPVHHQRTKHIEMDIHFLRKKVQRGYVRLVSLLSKITLVASFLILQDYSCIYSLILNEMTTNHFTNSINII